MKISTAIIFFGIIYGLLYENKDAIEVEPIRPILPGDLLPVKIDGKKTTVEIVGGPFNTYDEMVQWKNKKDQV